MIEYDVAKAADDNMAVHMTSIHHHLPSMYIEEDSLTLADSGLGSDTFNVICRARLDVSNADKRIRRAITYFTTQRRPFSWWHGPGATPADLPARLVVAGLEEAETEVAMVADLRQVPQSDHMPDGLIIERVRDRAQLHDFARTIGIRDEGVDADVVRFYELSAFVTLAPDAPLWFYVGYIEGVPVATAELTVGGGVVGLYNISTRADYRRRGIGTAMTLRPLYDARDQGHTTAILQASADGALVYPRLGFRSFGTITEYKPTATTMDDAPPKMA